MLYNLPSLPGFKCIFDTKLILYEFIKHMDLFALIQDGLIDL